MSAGPNLRLSDWRERFGPLGGRLRAAGLFAAGIAAALAALWLSQRLAPPPLTTAAVATAVAEALASATPPPAEAPLVYQVIQPSLVLIQADRPGGRGSGRSDHSLGSGVIVSDQGDILTSLHVVTNATSIELIFADGTRSAAELVAAQPEQDIAVLRAAQLPDLLIPATLGNPGALRVGDPAFVVGNPFGLYSSFSAGVISGFDRNFTSPDSGLEITGLIQIDTAVNPGNSGGPLLNRAGQVVGIVAALINPTEQEVFIGIGLAVPITTAAGAAGLPPY